ncbi:response regulator [candidate division KSB1 bacterium]
MPSKKILVVDDEDSIRQLFEEIFLSAGYDVITVESAEEALDLLENESIKVMFLDLNLPGMSGIELCKTIRKENKEAYIYAVTGFTNIFGAPECLKAGFNDYFFKPTEIKTLIDTAQKAFEALGE